MTTYAFVDGLEDQVRTDVHGALEEEGRRDDGHGVGGGPFEQGIVDNLHFCEIYLLIFVFSRKNYSVCHDNFTSVG